MKDPIRILVALILVVTVAISAGASPDTIRHSMASGNDLESLGPKVDGRYDDSMTGCGIECSQAFKSGFAVGQRSIRMGIRRWIKPIAQKASDSDPIFESLGKRLGYKLVVLTDANDTQALRDQIAGYNRAMYAQMLIEQKSK